MVVRQVLSLIGLGPSPDAKDVEIAVLRHQLLVLRRQVARPRYAPADRVVLAALAKLLPRDRWPIFLVTPAALVRWHHELVRRRWTYPALGRPRRALDPEVVDLVVRLARENPRWGYLRIVGVAALRWSDIDLDAATLTVHEQIVVVDGQDIIGPPKSASSRRTIALDTTTVNLLGRLWRHHRHTLTTSGRNPDRYLFVNANGQRLRPDYLTRRLATLITEAGLPPVRLHDLRHGAASLALAAGVDLKVVQEMLGHASIVTTADIYTKARELHQMGEVSAGRLLRAASE